MMDFVDLNYMRHKILVACTVHWLINYDQMYYDSLDSIVNCKVIFKMFTYKLLSI